MNRVGTLIIQITRVKELGKDSQGKRHRDRENAHKEGRARKKDEKHR
jgi:hypothetical protein